MTDQVDAALSLWGLAGAKATFITGRENRVYRVQTRENTYALRFKRPGYRSDAELRSELQWMAAMDAAGLNVPKPIPSRKGALLERIEDHRVDMLGWCAGTPIAPSPKTFHRLGTDIARLHDACDAWRPPTDFTRHSWNADGLLGEAPVWGRFWENPALDPDTRALLIEFREVAAKELAALGPSLDTGLIHADLVADNVLTTGDAITFIDFDDGGYGYRLFELATVLMKHHAAPDFQALTEALVAGYTRQRSLDTGPLDLFLALRAVTYVGWIMPRRAEPGAAAREARFVQTARILCQRALKKAG
ncbi:phosphotransferase enzyme family protein [Gymnodinialimonas sp.]